jgi:hypothetical protein
MKTELIVNAIAVAKNNFLKSIYNKKAVSIMEGTEKVLFRFFGNQIIQHISIKRLGYVLFFLYLYNYKSIRYASIATSHTVQ